MEHRLPGSLVAVGSYPQRAEGEANPLEGTPLKKPMSKTCGLKKTKTLTHKSLIICFACFFFNSNLINTWCYISFSCTVE